MSFSKDLPGSRTVDHARRIPEEREVEEKKKNEKI
jgi:hypothetical protein